MLGLSVALVGSALGCGNVDDNATPMPSSYPPATTIANTPLPSSTGAPYTPIATDAPTSPSGKYRLYPHGTRTGHQAVDRILDLIENGAVEDFIERTIWVEFPCAENNGSDEATAPTCLPGMAIGDPIALFATATCQPGAIGSKEALAEVLSNSTFSVSLFVVVAYETNRVAFEETFPDVMAARPQAALAVHLASGTDDGITPTMFITDDGRVSEVWFGCGEVVPTDPPPVWLLPPVPV